MAFSDCIASLKYLEIKLHEMFPIQSSCFCFLAKTKVFARAVIDQLTTVTGKLEECLGGLQEFHQLREDLSRYNYCPGELGTILEKHDQLLEDIKHIKHIKHIKGIIDGIGEDSLATGDPVSILSPVGTLIDNTQKLVKYLDDNKALLKEKKEIAKALEVFKFDSLEHQLLEKFPIGISRNVMADPSRGAIRLLHCAKRILIEGAGHGEESESKPIPIRLFEISIRLFEKIESIGHNFISEYILLEYLKVNAESLPRHRHKIFST